MMRGFNFSYPPNKDYFFVTNQTKRTKKLCERVEQILIADGCERVRDGKFYGIGVFSIKDKLQAATCEIKHSEKWGDYYDIKGENFGGAGSFLHDGLTKVIHI